MLLRQPALASALRLLALGAVALAACAAPAVVPPTSAPTPLSTATALPPTAVPTPRNTAVPLNLPVPATSASLANPQDVAVDRAGNLYVSDCGNQIDKIDLFGQMTVYAGQAASGFSGDGGPARTAEMNCPEGLAFDRAGNLYFADQTNNRIRRIDRNGLISTVAGSGAPDSPGGFAGDGGPATSAQLNGPTGIGFDPDDNLYMADGNNQRVRKMDRQGIITTVAGTGEQGFLGDGGPATRAELYLGTRYDSGIAFDAEGNLYIADSGNARVRQVDQHGTITTYAGRDGPVVSGDGGPATGAVLSRPRGLAFDAGGNLYIATAPTQLLFDARVRKIDQHGIIATVAGTHELGYSGDGGPAISAIFASLTGITLDTQGNLYIVDNGNLRVRKVDKNGMITTVVGGHY